jgi:hypothetical protein
VRQSGIQPSRKARAIQSPLVAVPAVSPNLFLSLAFSFIFFCSCQGSLHQEVLCSSKDCPIFYRRKKAQKDVADSQVSVDRFAALSF